MWEPREGFYKMRFEPGLKLARHSKLGKYFEGKNVSPINVEISPSGKCDSNCGWCFYRQKNNQMRGLDGKMFIEKRMQGLISEFAGMGVNSISWTGGGEPTLHPDFPKFVDWVSWTDLKQGLFTNALKEFNYDSTAFDWIRVSKTNMPWNKEILKKLKPKILGMCINYSGDDDEIREALEIAEDSGVSYVQVRPALKIHGERLPKILKNMPGEKFLSEEKLSVPNIKHPLLEITDYKFLGASEERNYTECEAFHFNPFIWQDGDVDVCGYQKGNKRYNLGNLYSHWPRGSEGKFKSIMRFAPKSVPVADNCQVCCKLNSMNSTIKHMRDLEDVDFP